MDPNDLYDKLTQYVPGWAAVLLVGVIVLFRIPGASRAISAIIRRRKNGGGSMDALLEMSKRHDQPWSELVIEVRRQLKACEDGHQDCRQKLATHEAWAASEVRSLNTQLADLRVLLQRAFNGSKA